MNKDRNAKNIRKNKKWWRKRYIPSAACWIVRGKHDPTVSVEIRRHLVECQNAIVTCLNSIGPKHTPTEIENSMQRLDGVLAGNLVFLMSLHNEADKLVCEMKNYITIELLTKVLETTTSRPRTESLMFSPT